MEDSVEIWMDDKIIKSVNTSFQPARGDKISIKGESYLIIGLSWALDYSELGTSQRRMRLNLEVEPYIHKPPAS